MTKKQVMGTHAAVFTNNYTKYLVSRFLEETKVFQSTALVEAFHSYQALETRTISSSVVVCLSFTNNKKVLLLSIPPTHIDPQFTSSSQTYEKIIYLS